MNIVLLSGGSGKRLWPLSNDIRSKQFVKIFKTADGDYESMVQRVYRQICLADKEASVTIATSKSQVSAIYNQLGDKVNVCVEPCRRDTFPAIALAIAYLHDIKGISEKEVVVVCPVDPYVSDTYFEALKELKQLVEGANTNLALLGIEPTYPSEKYGYVIPADEKKISVVKKFKEKPDAKKAKEYISYGALWNGGVFAFRVGYILDKMREITGFENYRELFANYHSLNKISFDYAVAEQENKLQVLRFHGEWKDLGTWNTLTEAMEDASIGKVMYDDKCENIHAINELNVPIICIGLKDIIVAASAEGILVSDKEQSAQIKPIVEQINQQIMFAEKSWGSFQVVDVEEKSMTIKVTLNPGHRMNYHYHNNRSEVWTILKGQGYVILDDKKQFVKFGDVIQMPVGCKHTIVAETELKIMEVQVGEEISVHDKVKCEYNGKT